MKLFRAVVLLFLSCCFTVVYYYLEVSSFRYFRGQNQASNRLSIKSSLDDDAICSSLLYGDKNVTYKRVPDLTTDEDVLRIAGKGCSYLHQYYSFPDNWDHLSEEELENPVAFSLLVHNRTQQLVLLLSAIYAPQNVYCIHVDLKARKTMFEAVEKVVSCFPNVFLTTKRVDVVYASYSRLQADINCMEDLLNSNVQWRYLINLCGQDFPLSTNREIVRQLLNLNGRNVIAGTSLLSKVTVARTKFVHVVKNKTLTDGTNVKFVYQTTALKSPPPYNMTIMKNFAYNVYSRSFMNWTMFESGKAKALLEWSRDTRTPDEHFWLMMESLEEAPGRRGFVSWKTLTSYVIWKSATAQCSGYWKHYSCVFGAGDVKDMLSRREFFANKFDVTYDALPVTCLRKWLDER